MKSLLRETLRASNFVQAKAGQLVALIMEPCQNPDKAKTEILSKSFNLKARDIYRSNLKNTFLLLYNHFKSGF